MDHGIEKYEVDAWQLRQNLSFRWKVVVSDTKGELGCNCYWH